MPLGIALLSAVVKAALVHIPDGVRTVVCGGYYDGCGADDSWPREI
jgi:hypothetical protein